MKCTILTILFVITFVNVNVAKQIALGEPVSLGPYSANVTVGELLNKYTILDPNDIQASDNARSLAELLRRMYGVGIYPLPPFDPYFVSDLPPYEIAPGSLLSGTVTYHYVRIMGAKAFNLDNLEIRLRNHRVDYDINFPVLLIDVNFSADLKFSNLIPFNLSGILSFTLEEVSMTGALQNSQMLLPDNMVYQVTGAEVNFNAKNVTADFNIYKELEDELTQSLNRMSEEASLTEIVSSFKEEMEKYVLQSAVNEINNIMSRLTVAQVLAYLVPTPIFT